MKRVRVVITGRVQGVWFRGWTREEARRRNLSGWVMNRRDGANSGNPAVREEVEQGLPQHVAWAAERPDGGRGFGFTGGHFHNNWAHDDFRTLVLNAIVWVAHGEVPPSGVVTPTPTQEELEANQDYPKPQPRNR